MVVECVAANRPLLLMAPNWLGVAQEAINRTDDGRFALHHLRRRYVSRWQSERRTQRIPPMRCVPIRSSAFEGHVTRK